MNVLEEPVLTLNKNWTHIGMTTVKHAMTKLCGGDENGDKAVVMGTDYILHDLESWMDQSIEDKFIQLPHRRIAIPEVIIVTRYGEVPKHSVKWSRVRVFKRDKFVCQYCGFQTNQLSKLTIDHVLPSSRGGKTSWENCVAACYDCNAKKADRTPTEAGMRLRKAPGAPFSDLVSQTQDGTIKESWKPFIKNA